MVRTRQDEQVVYSAVTFRCLLDSLARPGKVSQLEAPPFANDLPSYFSTLTMHDVPLNRYALGAFLTLLDKEVTFALAADNHWLAATNSAVRWVVTRSGTSMELSNRADFAFFCDSVSMELVRQVRKGTLLDPESSTTVFFCVEQIVTHAEMANHVPDEWLTLNLSGPGIATTRTVHLLGLNHAALDGLDVMRRPYPLGIDIYLIDAAGRCIGLPRTTRIQLPERVR